MIGEAAAIMSIPVPSIITSSPSGGRFDFDDGGTYCGGWQDGKAHGHGVCTGPKNVGEYSGSWNFGFEMSGVYKWKNGAVYEGRWQNGKRHGVGVEYNGKWVYKGEWSQGFKGRYGVKASSNSAVKYEGTWANGLQDGYGSETYSDGGYYQGQMCRGLRHGYGVRKSAPYGDSQLNNPNKNGLATSGLSALGSGPLVYSNSLQSAQSVELEADDSPKPEDGFKPNIERTLASKNGFVLVAKPLDVPMAKAAGRYDGGGRRGSLTNKLASARIPGSQQTPASLLKRGLRLRKQKSTSDLDQAGTGGNNKGANKSGDLSTDVVPFALSPEELDITDPTTVETYTGEWKQDKRNGHGVCERSDGLKYEGQWHNDMKCGYGVTTFKDGSREEGKYKNNILITESKVKTFFQLGSANIRQRIDEAVKMAQQAQMMALKKAEIADTRAATARDKAEQATVAALEADRDSQIAFSVARQYSDSQQQQQQQLAFGGGMGAPTPLANTTYNMGLEPSGYNPAGYQPNQNLQIRRISQHQPQHQFGSRFPPTDYTSNQLNMQQHLQDQQHQQHQRQQQYLTGDALFNGRRGSFRGGGAQQPLTAQAPSSYQATATHRSPSGAQRQPSSDPFSDLFDHYKSTGGYSGQSRLDGHQPSSLGRHRLHKQSSLDCQQVRGLRRFQMSSMDHADENIRPAPMEPQNASQNQMQQQLRHLITSGEEQQQHQQSASQQADSASSYLLHGQSTGGSTSSFYQQQTPSPDGWSAASQQAHQRQHQHQFNLQQQQQFQNQKQRDVHSLADEQLYLAGRRKFQDQPGGSDEAATDFAHYDFAISSGPRPAERCMRRTASLSRSTLVVGAHSQKHLSSAFDSSARGLLLRHSSAATTSPVTTNHIQLSNATGTSLAAPLSGAAPNAVTVTQLGRHQFLHQAPSKLQTPIENEPSAASSRLTLDSSVSSAGALLRKPSLQVRYDPTELGGLMSREEVAAMSHAQREQRRLEAEMAEKRAKQPLLHLYLSLKELIVNQKLLVTTLLFNILLFKLFADIVL